jgi:hypothetical protein
MENRQTEFLNEFNTPCYYQHLKVKEPLLYAPEESSIMNQRTIRSTLITTGLIAASLATVFVSGAAQAALIDRGGGLIYDTDLNVTWLQDANYAKTSGYDPYDGAMTWDEATTWAANLSYFDSVRNVTYTDWRLPTTTDTGAAGCNYANSGTDCGYNVDPASSEMAHLYFTELGNQSYFTTTGAVSGAHAGGDNPSSTLDDTGFFTNFESYFYWSGTEYAPNPGGAWAFGTYIGYQYNYDKSDGFNFNGFYAMAVRPGDVAAVPEAQTYALMLAGLGLIGWRARRRG